MEQLSSRDIALMFAAVGVLLASARVLGELARRLHQPTVLGELLAGIVLGPTLLGTLMPGVISALFPSTGPLAVVLDGLATLSIMLFLVVAGLEVDLSTLWRQGRAALVVGVAGIVVPFTLGLLAVGVVPQWVGHDAGTDSRLFALFFATALSISALPVIARTLMDLNIYRSDLGMVVIAAAVLNDLLGWIIFALVLGMMGGASGHGLALPYVIGMTLGFVVVMLTVVRWGVHRALPWVQAHAAWPGGVLSMVLVLALFGAAITQWIGIHGIFGAFMVGVALGDSSHLRERTRTIIRDFVSFIFAPLFFASVGLRINFAAHFDFMLVAVVLVVACVGKVIGCSLGARWTGLSKRESWAIGFGMNARGAMEIVLGLLAFQHGLIHERMLVALVIMALVTSMMSGPLMQRILQLRKPHRLPDMLVGKAFIPRLRAASREDAIRELAASVCAASNLDEARIVNAVLAREALMSTGMGNGLAVPHARIEGLAAPQVAAGLAPHGIDFEARDGDVAKAVFLILTPTHDDGAQIDILADLARKFTNSVARQRVLSVENFTQLLAALRVDDD